MDAVCRDHRTAPIPERERRLFDYLERLTMAPSTLRAEDAALLTSAGWTDAEVFDAVTVCALFAFFNRWIDGNGVPDVPHGLYEERLERFGDFGYAPS